jgi:hypothetical protein
MSPGSCALIILSLLLNILSKAAEVSPQDKEPEPLTMACTAAPSVMDPGETATVTTHVAGSGDHDLVYSYKVSTGHISSTTNTAVFDATGASPGQVMITCMVSDAQGRSASDVARVTVTRGD